MIHGGSGSDTLIGGSGLDEIYGGSGSSTIEGHGLHDLLVGGDGWNKITPKASGDLASIAVKDHANQFTWDGNDLSKARQCCAFAPHQYGRR
jgi:Ca2+-binding RTX toxin-like protein